MPPQGRTLSTQQQMGPQEERRPYASPPHTLIHPYPQALLALMADSHALNLFQVIQLIQMQKPDVLNLMKLILILSLFQMKLTLLKL